MDFIGSILNQMSSAFNQETDAEKKGEINTSISEDKTLKWRGLYNNSYAAKEGMKTGNRRSKRAKSEISGEGTSFSKLKKSVEENDLQNNEIKNEKIASPQIATLIEDKQNEIIKNKDESVAQSEPQPEIPMESSSEVTLIEIPIDTVTVPEEENPEEVKEELNQVPSSPLESKVEFELPPVPFDAENVNIFAQMSSTFNEAVTQNNKEVASKMSEDKTLKWRALLNNQYAAKDTRSGTSRRSTRNNKMEANADEDEGGQTKIDGRTSRRSKRITNECSNNSELPAEQETPQNESIQTKNDDDTSANNAAQDDNKNEDNVKVNEDKKAKNKINKTINKSDRSLRSKHIETCLNSSSEEKKKHEMEKEESTTKVEKKDAEEESNQTVAVVVAEVKEEGEVEVKVPKKRGRKKLMPSKGTDINSEKPKRGRIRKAETIEQKVEDEVVESINESPIKTETNSAIEQVVEEKEKEIPAKVPKKRGRKPKVVDEKQPKTASPLKKSPRLSRDGNESILASAIARQNKDATGTQTRLSRPIKLTAKILANEELRYGFEQQQNARLSLSSENLDMETEITPKKEIKSPQEEHEPFFAEPKTVKVNGKKADSPEIVKAIEVIEPKTPTLVIVEEVKVVTPPTPTPTLLLPALVPQIITPVKKPCPDPEQFLNEIKQSKIALNRSPEDNKKLNRKQQKRLSKLKEKHLQMLGLKKATKQDSDSESVDTSEDGNEEFIPTKKINVGKPNVTLRLRNQHNAQPSPLSQSPASQKAEKEKEKNQSPGRPGRKRKNLDVLTNNIKVQEYMINAESPHAASPNKLVLTKKKKSDEQTLPPPLQNDQPVESNTVQGNSKPVMVELPCNFICLCRQKTKYFVRKSKDHSFCTAVDEIDGQKIGCCNELSGEILNLIRPSVRVSYTLLCDSHKRRMWAHNCCASCGVFCTQGNFILCSNKHIFHRDCADKFILNTPYNLNSLNFACPTLVLKCPHCGVDAPNEDYKITMKCQTVPVFLPFQRGYIKPAKMIVPSNPMRSKNNFLINMEALVPPAILNVLFEANKKLKSQEPISFTVKDFFYAIYNNNNIEKVAEIIASGFDLSTPFKEFHNGTCLHLVSNFGSLIMAYLILCRTNSVDYLNILDKEMRSAIMCAVLGGKNDILKLLIQSGADVTLKGPDGMTVLHLSAKIGNLAAAKIILDSFREICSTNKLQLFLNSIDDGNWTALVWAAENRHKDIVTYLISMGADVNICDLENNTVLHWAALSGDVDTLYPILTSNCDPNIQNVNGDTPLHIACRQADTSICVLLISHGANLEVKNMANETPYDGITDENSDCAQVFRLNLEMRKVSGVTETKIMCSDISNGREKYPVQILCSWDCDDLTPDFKYITKNILLQNNIQVDCRISQMRVCNCSDNCISESCQCGQISIQHWYNIDGRLINDFSYHDPPMIFECNDVCGCNKILCKNRIVQNGLKYPIQVFECDNKEKGWGAKSLVKILKGSFVSEYTGEILTDAEADRRTDDSYFFDLGASEHCIDANYYGNISRFFNHSCDANIVPVRVYFEHQDLRFPKIAFFACRDIEINDEICFDYGEKFWSVKYKTFPCKCKSPKCRYPAAQSSTSSSSSSNHNQFQRI